MSEGVRTSSDSPHLDLLAVLARMQRRRAGVQNATSTILSQIRKTKIRKNNPQIMWGVVIQGRGHVTKVREIAPCVEGAARRMPFSVH